MPLLTLSEILAAHRLLPPKTLTIAVTEACNQRCDHCFVSAGESGKARQAPVEALFPLLREFRELGGEGVRFTGGEPLCHPHWPDLVRYAVEQGFAAVQLQSNGVLFDQACVALLKALDFPGLSLQISLDGAGAATHDLVRGEGAFAAAMRGLNELERGGLLARVFLFCTEMSHNLDEFPALLELAERLGVEKVVSGMLVSCGRGAAGRVRPPSPAQYLALVRRYREDPRFAELYRKMGRVAAIEWSLGDTERVGGCSFLENPYLTAGGTLYPCLFCHADPYAVTGVLKKGLALALAEGAPLWSGLAEASRRRREEIGRCRECAEKLTCGAGCLGRAWGSCGDIMAPDDRCEIRRLVADPRQNSSL